MVYIIYAAVVYAAGAALMASYLFFARRPANRTNRLWSDLLLVGLLSVAWPVVLCASLSGFWRN